MSVRTAVTRRLTVAPGLFRGSRQARVANLEFRSVGLALCTLWLCACPSLRRGHTGENLSEGGPVAEKDAAIWYPEFDAGEDPKGPSGADAGRETCASTGACNEADASRPHMESGSASCDASLTQPSGTCFKRQGVAEKSVPAYGACIADNECAEGPCLAGVCTVICGGQSGWIADCPSPSPALTSGVTATCVADPTLVACCRVRDICLLACTASSQCPPGTACNAEGYCR